jgi:hypothetical protein
MRILRGLSSKFLTCGCLAGVYETYDGEVVGILDAKGSMCTDGTHQDGKMISIEFSDSPPLQADASSHRPAD